MTVEQHDPERLAVPGIDPATAVQVLSPEVDRHRWLALRRTGIGGSDVSALVGLSPYRSRYELWCDKTRQLPLVDAPPSEAARWGTLLEPVVRDEFAAEHAVQVRQVGMLRSARWPWMLANPDGLCDDGAGYEGKTCSMWSGQDWADGQVPDHAELQVQWCMAVTGLSRWHVAVLIGGQRFLTRTVQRDDALISQLVNLSHQFWRDNVENETEPPLDGSAATTALLSERYPTACPGTSLNISPEHADELMTIRARAQQAEREARAEGETVRNRVRALLGDAEQLVTDDGRAVATWRPIEQLHLARLRAERPDMVERYSRSVHRDEFDVETFRAEQPDLYRSYRIRQLRFTQ